MADSYLSACYQRALAKTKILTAEEESALVAKIKQGDKSAEKKLVESSLRTVWQIARKYATRDVDIFDLIQEGNLGLLCAVEKYDPSVNTRFNTYAIFWIRQKIMRYYNEKVRLIRIPVCQEVMYYKIRQFRENYAKEHVSPPTSVQIAEGTNIPLAAVKRIITDTEPIDSLDHNSVLPNAIDSPAADRHGDMRLNPEEAYCKEEASAMLDEAIATLPPREQELIRLRYGFYDREYTLIEVADKFHLTPEGVRQLQKKAVSKMNLFYRKRGIKI